MNTASFECFATCVGIAVAIFFSTTIPSAAFVSSAILLSSSADGFERSIPLTDFSLIACRPECTTTRDECPCFTTASNCTAPLASTDTGTTA